MPTLVSTNPTYEVRISRIDRLCTTLITGGDTRMCDGTIHKGDELVAQVVLDSRGKWAADLRKYCRSCACTKIKCISIAKGDAA